MTISQQIERISIDLQDLKKQRDELEKVNPNAPIEQLPELTVLILSPLLILPFKYSGVLRGLSLEARALFVGLSADEYLRAATEKNAEAFVGAYFQNTYGTSGAESVADYISYLQRNRRDRAREHNIRLGDVKRSIRNLTETKRLLGRFANDLPQFTPEGFPALYENFDLIRSTSDFSVSQIEGLRGATARAISDTLTGIKMATIAGITMSGAQQALGLMDANILLNTGPDFDTSRLPNLRRGAQLAQDFGSSEALRLTIEQVSGRSGVDSVNGISGKDASTAPLFSTSDTARLQNDLSNFESGIPVGGLEASLFDLGLQGGNSNGDNFGSKGGDLPQTGNDGGSGGDGNSGNDQTGGPGHPDSSERPEDARHFENGSQLWITTGDGDSPEVTTGDKQATYHLDFSDDVLKENQAKDGSSLSIPAEGQGSGETSPKEPAGGDSNPEPKPTNDPEPTPEPEPDPDPKPDPDLEPEEDIDGYTPLPPNHQVLLVDLEPRTVPFDPWGGNDPFETFTTVHPDWPNNQTINITRTLAARLGNSVNPDDPFETFTTVDPNAEPEKKSKTVLDYIGAANPNDPFETFTTTVPKTAYDPIDPSVLNSFLSGVEKSVSGFEQTAQTHDDPMDFGTRKTSEVEKALILTIWASGENGSKYLSREHISALLGLGFQPLSSSEFQSLSIAAAMRGIRQILNETNRIRAYRSILNFIVRQ